LAFLPWGILALTWFPTLEKTGFSSPPLWGPWSERLSPEYWLDNVLGGLRGPVEIAVLLAVAAWVIVGLWQAKDERGRGVDSRWLWAAGVFFLAALVLPDKFQNTVRFAGRWAPWAGVFGVLACPAPRWTRFLRRLWAVGIFTAFSVATVFSWRAWERDELTGFQESVAALPENPRVLGLVWLDQSEHLKGRPFLQLFAYAQVLRGGTLNFSFGDFGPSPVVYRDRLARLHWTQGLEWMPERVTDDDLRAFDWVLVGASPEGHSEWTVAKGKPPIAGEGLWRLYRSH
jgi:hypothetical protein